MSLPDDQSGILANPLLDATALGADDTVDLAVPANARWKVWHLFMHYIATATAQTRTVRAFIINEDNEEMGQLWAAVNVTASQNFHAVISVMDMELLADVMVERPLQHPLLLRAAYSIRVQDTAAKDNADTVEWRGIVERWIED